MSCHAGTALALTCVLLFTITFELLKLNSNFELASCIDESKLLGNAKRLRGGHQCADLTVTANESIASK